MSNERLSNSLKELHKQQKEGNIFRSENFTGNNLTYLRILLSRDRMDDACGRICGALKFVGREKEALRIKESYEMATFKHISLVNPFERSAPILLPSRERNPYALRLKSMWHTYREEVVQILKEYQFDEQNREEILLQMDDKYQADAYHSLSIEGYKVTLNLIDRVVNGQWSPDENSKDEQARNALAAKGYYLAFEAVKQSIKSVIKTNNQMSHQLEHDHHIWYQKLFEPSIISGLLEAHHLAGYRNHQVYLQGSKHVPFPKEAIVDAMEVYFELLKEEENPLVQAILGHHMFGYIHPYMDGNGRMARFVMNALLVSQGYPWVIIRVDDREQYMQGLEEASVEGNIEKFARFILREIGKG